MNKFDLLKKPPLESAVTDDNTYSQSKNLGKNFAEIELSDLIPFDKQPFKPYSDAKLEALAQSIKENGVLSPILVRRHGNKYQIIAGHNRVLASKLLGRKAIPAIIEMLDDAQSTIALVESNFITRTEFAHSEKARAYKLEYEARKQQGERNDLTSGTIDQKLTAAERLAEISNNGEHRIRQYVQIANLIDPFLEMLDADKLPFIAAYHLSFLQKSLQEIAFPLLSGIHIDVPLSEKIRNLGDKLCEATLATLLEQPRPPAKIIAVKIKFSKIKTYFTKGENPQQIAETIMKALEIYFSGDKND